ncbi:hypothetical protein KJ765_05595 [Candidatus Micrarchaeota archaeon]|nr:hypothetical protein [Candidatus Micrarchaeota archaeon]
MAESFFRTLEKTKSPEELVERVLLPALYGQKTPQTLRKEAGGAWARMREPISRHLFRRRAKKWIRNSPYHRIGLVNAENPRQVAYIQLERTHYRDPRKMKKGEYSTPKGKVFHSAMFPLDAKEFEQGIRQVGIKQLEHPSSAEGRASITEVLRIPASLVIHDEWKQRLEPPSANAIHFRVNAEQFRRLEEFNDRANFVRRYLATVTFLNGRLTAPFYLKKMGLSRRLRLSRKTYYQRFHIAHQQDQTLMQNLAHWNTESEIRRNLEARWGIKGAFIEEMARQLHGVLKHEGARKMAHVIADDSLKGIARIPERRRPLVERT